MFNPSSFLGSNKVTFGDLMGLEKKVLLITGGAGFVGHHFVEHFYRSDMFDKIFIVDSLTYSGNLDRLRSVDVDPLSDPRVKTLTWDFRTPAGLTL